MKILFVCSGNTCRSPMALALARELARRNNLKNIEFGSAGLTAFDGAPISSLANEVLKKRGIDFSFHRAKSLEKKEIEEADLILTMTKAQKEEILRRFPQAASKTKMLMEYAGLGEENILDPIGGTLKDYEACANKIEKALRQIFGR